MDASRPVIDVDKRLSAGTRIPRPVWLLSVFLFVGALLTVTIGWLGEADAGHQRQQLPDGSTMELIGTTFGDNHRFLTGVHWQKLLWPLGIPELNERLDSIHDLSLTGAAPRSLALWVRHDPPCPFSRHLFEAFDETGATVIADSSAGWGDAGNAVDPVEVLDVSTFPDEGKPSEYGYSLTKLGRFLCQRMSSSGCPIRIQDATPPGSLPRCPSLSRGKD